MRFKLSSYLCREQKTYIMKNELKGSKLTKGWTVSQDTIELMDSDGNYYRIKVDEVVKVLNTKDFSVSKKRKYNHLTLNNKRSEVVVNFTSNDAEDMVSEVHKGVEHFATWSYKINGTPIDVKITLGDDEV